MKDVFMSSCCDVHVLVINYYIKTLVLLTPLQYPVTRQGTPDDYKNYPLLCEAIRKAFNDAGHPDWLITVGQLV